MTARGCGDAQLLRHLRGGHDGRRRRAGSGRGYASGAFHWHRHDEQDEFFLVLDGRLPVELAGRDPLELGPRQGFSVPAGLQHRPVVPASSSVIMIERAGVQLTGDSS